MADNSTTTTYIPTIFGSNSFFLKHQGNPIFYKKFNSQEASVVNLSEDTISIPNHFFVTGERLTYIPEQLGTRLQISPSSPGNLLSTTFLPDEVYPIVLDPNTIKIALSEELALQNEWVDFTALGTGSVHAFECDKKNTKCLLTIDNIIQSPVSTSSTVGVIDIVSSNSLVLDSLIGVSPGTILKVGEEYTKVINIVYDDVNIGYGTVTVLRGSGILGTPETTWDSGITSVTIMSGQYNIVQDKIYFTDAPFEGKKYNYDVTPDDFAEENYSVTIFDTPIKTGSVVGIITQNPPKGIDASRFYFAIKNYENNFSFAGSYDDAVNGNAITFDLDIGEYDSQTPIGNMIVSLLSFSEGSSFSGRAFLRSEYTNNLVFDDISQNFNGISSTFELKSSGVSTSGISSDNGVVLINNIFQYPEFEESFIFEDDTISGISSIRFIGIGTTGDGPKDYDVNVKGYPRGGIIVGYGLSGGRNYQPLRQAKLFETFNIPGGIGNIINSSNIGIAYSGSGYRISSGYAASITFEQDGERISGYGTALIQDGYVIGVDITSDCEYLDVNSPPEIVIEPPFEYEDILVVGSPTGIGAKVSFDISDFGEITNFRFTNPGYAYSSGDILTVPNTIGISSQTPEDELQIIILNVTKDTFSAWNLGKLRKLDDLGSYVNGTRRRFNLMENGQLVSIESLPGSPIDLDQVVLVFVNDVLQIPGESYVFNGGTEIIMSEPPATGSSLKVYFYEGSDGDTIYNDIDPKIKVGDRVLVKKNLERNPQTQFNRTVKKIISSDKLKTEIYNKRGLSYNSITYRPLDMTPQKQDLIIGGEIISKSRESLDAGLVGFTSITYTIGTFSEASATNIGINTTGLQIGDYIESIYTDNYTIASIQSGQIGISTEALNFSATSVPIQIWRKNS
jgi:flagellar motor switch/type III secretory pathway protein FliN